MSSYILILISGTAAVLLVPLIILYYQVQVYFRRTGTELRRLILLAKSPVFVEIQQSLIGVQSLCAFGCQHVFKSRIQDRVDKFATTFLTQEKGSSWLNIRLDLIGSLISFGLCVIAVSAPSLVSKEYLAVALLQSFSISPLLQVVAILFTQAEGMMASIERIKSYTDGLPMEEWKQEDLQLEFDRRVAEAGLSDAGEDDLAPLSVSTPVDVEDGTIRLTRASIRSSLQAEVDKLITPPEDWPSRGKIEFVNASMAYRDGPLVLKNLNFNIAPQEKCGIVGRTGSGKSSILVALFKIEKLKAGGQILVDDIDIDKVPVHILRDR